MLFDPTKREHLPPILRTGISQVMQYGMIDEIFNADVWAAKDVVFHGGTSVHVVWNSPRYSEDLDFLISVERAADIAKVIERAARGVEQRLMLSLPGSEVRVKPPKSEPGLRETLKYEIVWSHPRKIGVVKVKVEFYTVEPAHIENYRREIGRHRPQEMIVATRPELADFDLADLTVRSLIPAAHPESIYGDKLVALARRPYLKNRDFFDLWWLATQLGTDVEDGRLYEVMRRSADCYAYDDDVILEGLRRFQEHPPGLSRDIEDNLRAFLPESVHRRLAAAGAFEEMYAHAMAETGRLMRAIEERIGPEIRP